MGGLLFDRDKKVLNQDSTHTVFLLMSRSGIQSDKGLVDVSPFLIQRSIDAVGGKVKLCKKLRSGQLLIECFNGKQANKIIKMITLSVDIFVQVEEHKTLNKSRGIFYSNDLRGLSDTELLREIQEQNPNVTEIKRLKKRDSETKQLTDIDLGLYIVTFNIYDLPEKILLGYLSTIIRPYIPNPLRCFTCFQFGHVSEKCSSQEKVCPHCGNLEHTKIDKTGRHEKCDKPPKCANCQQKHNSFSKECDVYKKEYAIQVIKITQKKSIYEARKEYERKNQLPTTYSNTVKSCNCQCKCQESENKKLTMTTKNNTTTTTKDKPLSSPVRQITKANGSKIELLPRNISKRKKREITNAEKKKKEMSTNTSYLNKNNPIDKFDISTFDDSHSCSSIGDE